MTTKRQVFTLGKKLFGRRFRLEENRVYDKSMSEFKEGLERRRELEERRKQCSAEKATLSKGLIRELATAARFVVDVNGDEPSIGQLAPITERAERFLELAEEIDDLFKQKKKYRERFRYRYQAGTADGMFFTIIAEANTLDDLKEKLESEHEKDLHRRAAL